MKSKTSPNEKGYAKAVAEILKKKESYVEVQLILKKVSDQELPAVRNQIQGMVSRDLLWEHDLEVELERFANENYKPKPDEGFQKMLDNIYSDLNNEGFFTQIESNSNRRILPFYTKNIWAIAALFVALMGIIFVWKIQMKLTSEKLFVQYFEPIPETYSAVIEQELSGFGATSNKERLLAQRGIINAYTTGNYEKVIDLSESYFEKFPANGFIGEEEINLYLGISYLGQGEANRTIELLNDLLKKPSFLSQNDAKWYIALAWIHEGNIEKAKLYLNDLTQKNDWINRDKAVTLMREIE